MANEARRLELTTKLMRMGEALMQEGDETKDVTISQIGVIIIFMGGLLFDENDVNKFSDLVSMFSAKKLIENMESRDDEFNKFMDAQAKRNSYDDIINKIQELRDEIEGEDYEDDED